MANKRKYHHPKDRIMGRSDVPLAERMRYQHSLRIARERERAAKVVTYAASIALHDVKGVGYRGLIRFGRRYMEYEREVYADGVEVGLVKAKRRMDALGLNISGERYMIPEMDATARQKEVAQNSMESSQVALTVCSIAINDEFGYGYDSQMLITDRMQEVIATYAQKGMAYLLQEMGQIGFEIRNGRAQYYLDEDDNVITKKQAEKLEGRK